MLSLLGVTTQWSKCLRCQKDALGFTVNRQHISLPRYLRPRVMLTDALIVGTGRNPVKLYPFPVIRATFFRCVAIDCRGP